MTLRIPPVLILACFGVLAWLSSILIPSFGLGLGVTGKVVGTVCLVSGTAVLIMALSSFKRASTTVDPINPENAAVLVTAGIYQFTRNPMYLAFALQLTGLAIYSNNILALMMPALFVFTLNKLQILPEEQVLRQKFGDQYERYCRRTGRWLTFRRRRNLAEDALSMAAPKSDPDFRHPVPCSERQVGRPHRTRIVTHSHGLIKEQDKDNER